jgi:DNA-binding response OmpR family regulator
MELAKQDSKAFEDLLAFLQSHPEIKKYELINEPMISLPNLEIHLSKRKVFRGQQEIPLTKTEYEILLYLLQNANRVLTHSQIYEKVWRELDYGEAQKLVSHHVQAIRRKLNLEKESGVRLRCIRDVGYCFEKE